MLERRHQVRQPRFVYDSLIISSVLCLIALGLLMVGSASMVISDRQYGFAFYYLIRQVIYVSLGIVVAWVATRVPLRLWEKYSRSLCLFGLFVLLLVLVPGIGRTVNGSRRWIHLGIVSLQVSEFVKLTAVLYLSSYLARFRNQVKESLSGFIKPMILLAIIGVLLLLEPDFGGFIVISVTFLALLFVAEARFMPFCVMFFFVLVCLGLLAVASPYRLLRLTTFLDPWKHAFSSGYQLTQSLIAFGRGGVLGVGLGNSIQKLFYLPEAHSDFVFAVLAEELGLLGELFLISLYIFFVTRLIVVANKAARFEMFYAKYVAYGVAFWLSCQALINMGVNCGILPTKGLTLPFISYGGSSMIVTSLAVGVVLRVAYEVSLCSGDVRSASSPARSKKRRRS